MQVPDGLIERLTSWRRVVVVGHVTPDADCLGAMFAAAAGFAEEGRRDVRLLLPEGSVSRKLAFMVEQARSAGADARALAEADGILVVDTARLDRCNVGPSIPDNWADGRDLVNIDHHASNTRFGRVNWVEPQAGSSSELIHRLLRDGERPESPLMCSLLYAGIITDTAGFTLPTTGVETLRTAAELVAGGADVADITRRLYRSRSEGEFQLLQSVYANTRLAADGRIAYSTAGHEEITRTGCGPADIDDQVNVPRSLRGVRIAMLLTEGIRGKTRINFRGEAGTRVLELAEALGGGGHAESAGAILDMPLEQAVPLVLARATEYLNHPLHGQKP